MSIRIYCVLLFIVLSLLAIICASAPYLDIQLGIGLAKQGKSQYYTPVSNLTNYYVSDRKFKITGPLLAIGAGYQFHFGYQYYTALGIEADYLNYGELRGTLHPAINIAPNFDTLSYDFSAESYLFMLKAKLGRQGHAWIPYLSLGLGFSVNELSNYNEDSKSSAAPTQILYQSNRKRDRVFSVAIGLYQRSLSPNVDFNISYRFINSGIGILRNPNSGSDSLSSGRLSAHFITLMLTFK